MCNENNAKSSGTFFLFFLCRTKCSLSLSETRKDSCYGQMCHKRYKTQWGHFQVGKQHVGSSLSRTETPAVPLSMGFPAVHSQIPCPSLGGITGTPARVMYTN